MKAIEAVAKAVGISVRAVPLKPGTFATMTHDYKSNGTTTLFAALDALDGTPTPKP